MIELWTGSFIVRIDEEKGGEVTHIGHYENNILAYSEWQVPVPIRDSTSYDGGILDWLSEYRGGWQCLFPNAGDACAVNDVPLPFHGEWSRTRLVPSLQSQTSVTLSAGARLPLTLSRTISLLPAGAGVHVTNTVTNVGPDPTPFVWAEHPALDLPAEARIFLPRGPVQPSEPMPDSPAKTQVGIDYWPLLTGHAGETTDLSVVPAGVCERLCYLPERPEGWAAAGYDDTLIGMSWDLDAFPHLWFWQELGGPGFPWYGRSSITAIEPARHWPSTGGLASAVHRGQALWLEPDQTATSWMTVSVEAWDGRTPAGFTKAGAFAFEAHG